MNVGSKMDALMAQSDAAIQVNLETLLSAAADQLSIEKYNDDADLRRQAARYASVLSTYIGSGLLNVSRAERMMRHLIQTGREMEPV